MVLPDEEASPPEKKPFEQEDMSEPGEQDDKECDGSRIYKTIICYRC